MGCDIHPVVEVCEFGEWKLAGVPQQHRYYDFFALLAGVRGRHDGEETCCAPMEEGEWKSKVGRSSWLGVGGWFGEHSFCIVTLKRFKEFRPVVEREAEVWPPGNKEGLKPALEYWDRWIALASLLKESFSLDEDRDTDEQVRFVFGFDS